MVDGGWMAVRDAWDRALYGPSGFYRREAPADHFRTSPHTSVAFAEAVVTVVRRYGVSAVWDLGAGAGELLRQFHALDPTLRLTGVEIRDRPSELPAPVEWQRTLPTEAVGLVIANEVLDNIPCDVVELDDAGACRLVEVDPATGAERLGALAPPEQHAWVERWWPLTTPGERAEVGLGRDEWWSAIRSHNPASLSIAIDYGHVRSSRPVGGSLTSYRKGRQAAVSFDGRYDVTAHVAFDSLLASTGGTLHRQRDVLRDLGLSGARPPIELASADPAGYVRALADATERAELTSTGGLGAFWWLVSAPS